MSTYSEQVNAILQTKLITQMQQLSMDVAKYEPYSYTSTTLEDKKRQLDYYSMIYDFLSEYVDGSEEITSAKLINVIRLLDPPTRERRATNYLNTSIPTAESGWEMYINDDLVTSQTVLEPGSTVTLTFIYTPSEFITGVKKLGLTAPIFTVDGFTMTIPNYYVDYIYGGGLVQFDLAAIVDGAPISFKSYSILIAYMTDRTFYYGVAAPGRSAAQIQGLTTLIAEKSDKTLVFSPNSQVYYFAYPTTYGALTSILDHNGFEIISDFLLTTESFTLVAPNYPTGTQDYYVYEYDLPTIQNNFNITFKF